MSEVSKPHIDPLPALKEWIDLPLEDRVMALAEDGSLLELVRDLIEQYESLRKAAEYAHGWLLAGPERDRDVAAHLKQALDGSNPASGSGIDWPMTRIDALDDSNQESKP